MFNEATFGETPPPSSGNEMIMLRIFKGNMWSWTKTINLTNKKKLRKVTN